MKNMRKKSVAVLAGLGIAGLVGAAAASLGGVNADNLGADVGVVSSCDTDGVDVAFGTGFDNGVNEVTTVDLSDVADTCDGQDVTVTLTGSGGPLGDAAAVADASGVVSVNVAAENIDAELVTGVAVVISGTPAP